MKIKTSELTGAALNWAVETLEIARMRAAREHVKEWWVAERQTDPSPYSSDWLRAGEIIDREKFVAFDVAEGTGEWTAIIRTAAGDLQTARGATMLFAAMRCYVTSRLGDEVKVPDELMEKSDE